MLQVAFEQGLLDLDKFCIAHFSEKGSLNYASLALILSSCTDFVKEGSMFQMSLKKWGHFDSIHQTTIASWLVEELSIAGEIQNICTKESRLPKKEEQMIFSYV